MEEKKEKEVHNCNEEQKRLTKQKRVKYKFSYKTE